MQEILALSGTRQAELVRRREISAGEQWAAHLARTAKVNPALNAAIEVYPEPAAIVDGPLAGVPFSMKDSIELAGTRCTAGTLGRKSAPLSTADAALVAALSGPAPSRSPGPISPTCCSLSRATT